MAAAFNAPIGGVLFALEEAATHWSDSLTSRAFFATITSALAMSWLLTGGSGVMRDEGLVVWFSASTSANFEVYEVLVFAAMGACGGLVGAAFNSLNLRLNRWRKRAFGPGGRLRLALGGAHRSRLAEAVLLAWLCATLVFFVPVFTGCTSLATALHGDAGAPAPPPGVNASAAAAAGDALAVDVDGDGLAEEVLVAVRCPPGHYNEMAVA